jgi:F-type H+-transporting ATPase subunit a
VATEHAAAPHSPLAQFEIKKLIDIHIGGYDVSYTNSALMMTVALALAIAFLYFGTRPRALVPGRLQNMAELAYEFVANIVRDSVGAQGRAYFPFVFSLFLFILFGNVIGLIPIPEYGFTFTSHIIVTFAMAAVVFVGVTVLGLAKHGLHFFSFFCPPGVSWVLMPLMIPIEIISYLSRPISLSVRLFANMTAGHIMLKVFAGFVPALGIVGVLPLGFVFALTGLELLIAFLQAYVFAVLTSLYINDALHLH